MQDTLHSEKRTGGALRLFIVGMLTIAATLVVNLVVRGLAFAIWPISPIFLPLQIGTISGFTIVLVGGGVLVFNPDTTTLPGVTPLAASILMVLHIIDASIAIVLLIWLAPSKGRAAKAWEDIL